MDKNSVESWLVHLEKLYPVTIDLGLERVAQVRVQANLEPRFPLITVGGTNGKGSTCAMLESILCTAGYKVGCYTSPHLIRYNERVRINGMESSDTQLCRSFEVIEKAREKIRLTYFEFGTLAAMVLFMEENVDVAILEVGLGGRLDAVNVFDADCAVITNVDLDHMDYLGDTREAIGYEKAGIFRSSRPAIYGQTDIPDRVVQQAQKVGARLQVLGREFGYERSGKTWSFHCGQDSFTGLPLPLMTGEYQLRNASAALTALLMMKERLPVSLQAMKHGLETAKVPGRFQIDGLHPQTIFDVAHNPHAARALAANLQMLPCKGRTIAVFAMLSDKDMGMVIQIMAPVINVWCIATINHVRGARADQLNELLVLKGVQSPILCFEDPVGAYEHACNVAGKNDRIIVFGSFHTVADCLVAHENAVVAG